VTIPNYSRGILMSCLLLSQYHFLSAAQRRKKIKRRSTSFAPHRAPGLPNKSVRARLLSDKILSQLQRRLTHDSTRVPVYPRGILEIEPSCVALVREPVSRLCGYSPLCTPPEGIFCPKMRLRAAIRFYKIYLTFLTPCI